MAAARLAVTGAGLKEKGMRRSTWICLDDCQAPFAAHLQSPWGASGKPRSWRRFPDKRYRGPTGATRSTVYLPSASHPSRSTIGVPPSLHPEPPSPRPLPPPAEPLLPAPTCDGVTPPMPETETAAATGAGE